MSFVSYAQNFEDVMLWRALGHVQDGFYIDVGASDPVLDSVTCAFHERGWRGINVEPGEGPFARLVQARPGDVNLPLAVGEAPGEQAFFRVGEDSGLSTGSADFARRHAEAGWATSERTVGVTTLARICAEHVHGPVHFLKVDAEGAERAVLAGADFTRWRPWVVLLEATEPNSQATTHGEWEGLLDAAGYRFAYFDGLNRFYLAAERHDELAPAFAAPPNVFDRFVRAAEHYALLRAAQGAEALREEQERRVAAVAQAQALVDAAQGRLDAAQGRLHEAAARTAAFQREADAWRERAREAPRAWWRRG